MASFKMRYLIYYDKLALVKLGKKGRGKNYGRFLKMIDD